MKKETPISEVINAAAIWKHAGAEISNGFLTTVEIIRRGEKDFARVCFQAGEAYISKHCGANLEDSPDFDEWYKQFEE